jgi:hypothetical protein
VKRTSWSAGLSVTGDGTGVVAHAGSAGLRLLADRTGLTSAVSTALQRRSFTPRHDRGRVLVDVAVMLADGGEAIADIDVLRHQSQVLGPVASAPTVWRTLDELTPARLKRIDSARARVRRPVWSALPDGLPASKVAGTDLGEVVVLDVDATIVVSHGEKENAAPTLQGTFGFHPLGVWCDNTTELLAARLLAGNAGANTAADHIEVLAAAINQIPRAVCLLDGSDVNGSTVQRGRGHGELRLCARHRGLQRHLDRTWRVLRPLGFGRHRPRHPPHGRAGRASLEGHPVNHSAGHSDQAHTARRDVTVVDGQPQPASVKRP